LGFVVEPMEFFEDIQEASLKVAKACMEAGLEGCRDELIGADRHARGGKRSDSRNGYYPPAGGSSRRRSGGFRG